MKHIVQQAQYVSFFLANSRVSVSLNAIIKLGESLKQAAVLPFGKYIRSMWRRYSADNP